ncbi:MAG: hypothetical protein CSH37_14075 [Thalassolituus sp.]|jgi:hypothetical protein|nr:MAG: hypothetical protein CSH37_14075 [Thalassolituus sp.]
MRQLILAAAIIIAVLSAVWFTQPRLIEGLNNSPDAVTTTDETVDKTSSSPAAQNSASSHAHIDHGHDHDHDGELPAELEEYIESQRIPASEIPITVHGDGTATIHTKKQYSTVMMMVIDEDGTRRMVERQITPEGTLVVPYEEAN